jgi:hypothetical protein
MLYNTGIVCLVSVINQKYMDVKEQKHASHSTRIYDSESSGPYWTVRASNPGGGEIFCTRTDRPWGPPSLLHNGHRVFPGSKADGGVALTTHPHLVLRLKGRALPLLPLWAFLGCSRLNFTFIFTWSLQYCRIIQIIMIIFLMNFFITPASSITNFDYYN